MSTETKKRRRKGERPDGRIQVTYTDGLRPDGKPNRLSFYGRTRAEAEAKRDEYIHAKRGGLAYSDRGISVADWVARWEEKYAVDVEQYRPYINRILSDLGKRDIQSVREDDLVASLGRFEGRSRSGATKYRMIIEQVFRRAYRNKIIQFDPSEDLDLPDVTSGTHRALERWEVEAIVQNWRVYPAGRWAMLMLFCGLRRGEMIALDWSSVDLGARTISVNAAVSFARGDRRTKDTKTEAGMRVLPIASPLFEMLVETPEAQRVGAVCLSASGKPISHSSVARNWSTFCSAVTNVLNGLPALRQGRRSDREYEHEKPERVFSCRMHDLRHTYATMLFEAGIAPKDAQYYLGHSDLRMTTELYTHLTEERKRQTLSSVSNYLDSYLEKA